MVSDCQAGGDANDRVCAVQPSPPPPPSPPPSCWRTLGVPVSIQVATSAESGPDSSQGRTYLSSFEDGVQIGAQLSAMADQHWLIVDQGDNLAPSSPSSPSPPACLRVEGTNANLDGQYEPQFTAAGTYYYARTGQSWTTGGAGYARTDGSMVIRTNGNRGGWNFCAASGGVVVEPCYAQNGRAGYVGDVQSQPAVSEIYDWGQSGDSFLSFGC